MLEEYDRIDRNLDKMRDSRRRRNSYIKEEPKKEEELELSQEEKDCLNKIENCPFCHKNNIDIRFEFFLNKPQKRYVLSHHCSVIRCTIQTESFSSINDLVTRWNGHYERPEKKNF